MHDTDRLGPETLIRLTPKTAPFRRGGVGFPTLAVLIMPLGAFRIEQLLALVEEPLVDVDESRDGGDSWRRHDLSPLPDRRVVDPALSPERAIDPTGSLVPREPIRTADGSVAPPEAADPAVPVAGETVAARNAREQGRSVATGTILKGEGTEGELRAADHAAEAQLAADQAEADRVAVEMADAERLAAEQAEADRIVAETLEAERLAAQRGPKTPARGSK